MFSKAVAAILVAQPVATPSPVSNSAAAEITRLESQWGEAFIKRDFEFIDGIVAPEYRLVVADEDGHRVTLRTEWMKNARTFTHHGFTVETVDVNLAGDTAVASAKGLWTVSMREGMPPVPIRFFVTDTWVRRGGEWQVIHRYSHRLPGAARLPAMPLEPQPK